MNAKVVIFAKNLSFKQLFVRRKITEHVNNLFMTSCKEIF